MHNFIYAGSLTITTALRAPEVTNHVDSASRHPSQKVRFRCDFFPFVEPGVDMSIEWKGDWLEIMGAGMVHPRVLENAGYDSTKYTGFAFGMGPERISMLKNEITDIRHFFSNDLRFLTQF